MERGPTWDPSSVAEPVEGHVEGVSIQEEDEGLLAGWQGRHRLVEVRRGELKGTDETSGPPLNGPSSPC